MPAPTLRRIARAGAVVAIVSLAARAGVAQKASKTPALRSAVFPADSARATRGSSGLSRSIVDSATAILAKLEMHETTLPPGGSPHPPHRHAHEELMIVRSGTIEALQGTVTRKAGPGSVVFMGSNELHGLRNPGPDTARYIVVRIDPHDLPPDAKLSERDKATKAWTDSVRRKTTAPR